MGKHLLGWIFVSLFCIIFLPMMFEPQTYLNRVKSDQDQLANEIGGKSASIIVANTDRIYSQMFEESGIHPWATKRFAIKKRGKDELFAENNADKAANFAGAYLASFFISMYEAIFHLTQLGYWAMFSLPFIIAAGFDGLMTRKVRNMSFIYSSPAKYNATWHIIIALVSGTAAYCTTPFAMPATVFPLLVFAVAMALRELLANLQRSA